MKIKGLVDEDFINYKLPSMYIIFPYCDFKCDRENGCALCQNSALVHEPDIEVETKELVRRYISNPITKAIVLAGLEPIDSWNDLLDFLSMAREASDDMIVIYTGYTEEELAQNGKLDTLIAFKNIVIKFGRFRPDQESHKDEVLGVTLCSPNQYAREYL